MTVDAAVDAWIDEVGPGRIVIAASGGADSSVLAAAVCDAVRRRDGSPAERALLAHFDHRTRSPDEHERDLQTVRALADRLGAPLVVGRARGGEPEAGEAGGPEARARSARYRFLLDACRGCGASVLATGHTRDDQVETVLMRLLDGMTGTLLAGIPPVRRLDDRVSVHRPLLDVSRGEVDEAVQARRIGWSEDATNAQTAYRRNRVRRLILPGLEREWPAVRRDLVLLAKAQQLRRDRALRRAAECEVEYAEGSARFGRAAFFALEADARLEVLYATLRDIGMLDRGDRPSHRFFAPLLGSDPGGTSTVIGARGIRIRLAAEWVLVERDIVRSGQSGYL